MPWKLQLKNKSSGRLEANKNVMIKQMLKTGVELSQMHQQYRARLDFLCCSNDRVLVLRRKLNIDMEK